MDYFSYHDYPVCSFTTRCRVHRADFGVSKFSFHCAHSITTRSQKVRFQSQTIHVTLLLNRGTTTGNYRQSKSKRFDQRWFGRRMDVKHLEQEEELFFSYKTEERKLSPGLRCLYSPSDHGSQICRPKVHWTNRNSKGLDGVFATTWHFCQQAFQI